jgi:MGT family glycosyltransferase
MATILAYTSPALGHLLPMSALLSELCRRGHSVHIRTLSDGVEYARGQGFSAAPIDPRVEAIELDDWKAANPLGALKLSISAFARRAPFEIGDFSAAVAATGPDAVLVDVNCWGALTAADAGPRPWACFSPYSPALSVEGVPPFGLGLRPLPGRRGRWRDTAVQKVSEAILQRPAASAINEIRRQVGVEQIASLDDFLRRAPLLLLATGAPFQYAGEFGPGVHMIGPCVPAAPQTGEPPAWLTAIDQPIVLVTTSSERQNDDDLVGTAVAALAGEPVHVVASMPAAAEEVTNDAAHATIRRFVDHDLVLSRAVCAVTHGGMGVTQRALLRGVPVCVVPYGRDQFEVARRAEVAGCGTRLPARRMTVPRLRAKIAQAMTMTAGAARVAEGFAATGGVSRGADLFEELMG